MTEIYLAERARVEERGALVAHGIDQALLTIKYNFELSQNPFNNLPYHNREHSQKVMRRTETILRAIQSSDPTLVSQSDIELGRFAAAYHDIVQDWDEVRGRRKRRVGANEKESVEIAVYFLDRAKVFSDRDKRVVAEAINVTIPGFSPELGTITQPLLNPDSSLVATAVALADIGACGLDGPEIFLPEGDSLFREENLDILRDSQNKFIGVSYDRMESYRQKMLNWTKSQLKFVEGRQALLESDLASVPHAARERVKKLFAQFENSKQAIGELIERRENLSFMKLAEEFGYLL